MRSPASTTMFWRLTTALVVANCIAACADVPASRAGPTGPTGPVGPAGLAGPEARQHPSDIPMRPPHVQPLDPVYVTPAPAYTDRSKVPRSAAPR